MLECKSYYSFECDLWSLGCILFNMVAGFPPFYEDDEPKLIK